MRDPEKFHAAAALKSKFGGQKLRSGTLPGRGSAPGAIFITTGAIFIAISLSHDEEGVVSIGAEDSCR